MEQVGKALEENRNILLRTLDVAAIAIASKLWWDNTNSRPVSLIAFVTDTPDGSMKDLQKICDKIREKHKDIASIINALDIERDAEDQTALALACRLGKVQFVKYFLEAGCNDTIKNSNGWLPIHLAALTGKQGDEIVRLLLEHNKDNATATNEMNGWTPFHIAISKNSFKQIPLYLHTNLNATTSSGHSPVMIAACEGLTQWVTELISRGVDLSCKELAHRETALHYAAINGHSTIVQLLVDAGAEVNATTISGASPLHYAVAKGHVTIVKYLLQHKADVNLEKSDGFTPLHNAAVKGNAEIAQLLIEKGSKLNTKSKFGRSPLHEAAYTGNYDVAKLLVDAGADINCIDNDGLTPLHTCCGARGDGPLDGFLKIVDLLTEHGADVNYMWNENCTALHKAACAGDRGVTLVERLLSRGGDPTIENCLGWTPLHWANSEHGSPASVTIIENYLKNNNPEFLKSFDKNKAKDFDRKSRSDRPMINISEQDQHDVLDRNLTLEGIAQRIKSGKSKKIVVLTGAGISVSAGIPDFRSPTGVYSTKFSEQYGISANVFDLHSLQTNPVPFFKFCKDTFLPVVKGTYKPTAVHHFLRLLNDKGLLLRNYTQNIDMLERMAGVPGEKMVESHGTFAECRCMSCNKPGNIREFWDAVDMGDVPICSQCNAGVLRPNVVFFGEGLPSRFADLRLDDLRNCDLLIVMGTSLMVYPFAGLVNEVNESTPRLLINRDPVGVWRKYVDYPNANKFNYRDVSYLGNCDDGIRELAKLLGWQDELLELETKYVPNQ